VKVLFSIKRLASAVGGAERVLCKVCSELVNRGHEVTILTFDPLGGQPFYPLDPRVKRIDLGIGDSSQPAGLIETLVRIRRLRLAVNLERPDVAVGFMHSMFVPLAFALAGTGIPVLGSEHIVPEHYRTRRLQYFLLLFATPFINRMTVLSRAIRSRYPWPLKKLMIDMPNPVEAAANQVNANSTKECFFILSVGRLEAQKDHSTLVRAFAQITHQFPQWHLRIVGEGSLRTNLSRLIKDLNLQAKVTLPGVTHTIANEYVDANVFVIPSRYEAFGLVTAEAMSYGLPVVGFADCSGTNELIEEGRTGFLVQPGQDRVEALAYTLANLMNEPSLRKRMGDAGRDVIIARFSAAKVYDLWENLLYTLSRKNKMYRDL
jgi:glycosyltransferase involved in cell wall biosynthesis